MKVFYFGFNLRQVGDAVVFGSAPGTGASLLAEKFTAPQDSRIFYAILNVDGASERDVLNIEFTGTAGKVTVSTPIVAGMHRYELASPTDIGDINMLRISPSAIECVLSVKEIGFEP